MHSKKPTLKELVITSIFDGLSIFGIYFSFDYFFFNHNDYGYQYGIGIIICTISFFTLFYFFDFMSSSYRKEVKNKIEPKKTDNKFINILRNTFAIMFVAGFIFTIFFTSISIGFHNYTSELNIAGLVICLMIGVPAFLMLLCYLSLLLSGKY